MKTCIYGLGALGKRHLEGLIRVGSEIDKLELIHLVDPMIAKADLRSLKDSYDDPNGLLNLEGGPSEFMIDATNVNGRVGALQSNAEILVLEKPLFNSSVSLANFESALSARQTVGKSTWVNHARRYWPLYQDLMQVLRLNNVKIFSLEVKLNNAGLLSNYGHFLDLANWFSESNENAVEKVRLNKIFEAKRFGFNEAYGTFSGTFSDFGYTITDVDSSDGAIAVNVLLETDRGAISINEIKGTVAACPQLEDILTKKQYEVTYCYQSNLTYIMLLDYISSGRLELPTAEQVMRNNKPVVNEIEERYGDVKFT